MKKAGLIILENPVEITARILKKPQVTYTNSTVTPEQNGKWRLPRQAKYIRCCKVEKWCAIFLNVTGERMGLGDFEYVLACFVS